MSTIRPTEAASPMSPLHLRSDLVCREVQFDQETVWVVKDPLRDRFFHLSQLEMRILRLLDGSRTLEEVQRDFRQQSPDRFLGADDLVQFAAFGVREGLVAGGTPPDTPPSDPLRRLPNPFAITLPGIDPTDVLEPLLPLVRWVFGPVGIGLMAVILLAGALSLGLSVDMLTLDLRRSQDWLTPQTALATLVAVVLSKIVHELGHAFTSIHFGAPCREAGVMLLLLMPTLYCDVSDAWLIPSRFRRILVSAAGILAELVIASLAAVVWVMTLPGTIHFVALSLMIFCSLNTLLINGNPLLRYDGYYMLADFLGKPNLAAEAMTKLRQRLLAILFGTRPADPLRLEAGAEWPELLYGILSGLYRLALSALIGYGLLKAAAGRPWEPLADLLVLVLAGGVVTRIVSPVLRDVRTQQKQRLVGNGRLLGGLLLTSLLLIGVAFTPIRNSVSAPALVDFADSQDVYATVSGRLTTIVPVGTAVDEGTLLARLENPDFALRLLELENEQESQRTRLKAITARRADAPQLADEIPTLTQSLAALDEQIRLAHLDLTRLSIKSPRAGFVRPPRNVAPQAPDPRSVAFWSGTPLDPANGGCHIDEGTHLCTIGVADQLVVVAFVSQREIEHVRVGQSAVVALSGHLTSPVAGSVIRIASNPSESLPREIAALGTIPTDSRDPAAHHPLEPVYQVEIQLSASAGTPLLERSTAIVRIDPPWTSLWRWCVRQVRQALRFSAG